MFPVTCEDDSAVASMGAESALAMESVRTDLRTGFFSLNMQMIGSPVASPVPSKNVVVYQLLENISVCSGTIVVHGAR